MPKWTASISTLFFDIATMKQVPKRGLPTYSKLSKVTDSKKSYLEEVFLRFPLLTQHISNSMNLAKNCMKMIQKKDFSG